MSENTLETMENQLELFIENIRQVRKIEIDCFDDFSQTFLFKTFIIVSDFQPQGQAVLNQKIQTLIGDLQKIDKQSKKSEISNIHIPLAVFDYIDTGRNPQLYTKEIVEKALYKNEETKGKIDSYRKFKNNLLLELQKEFPAEINKYRALRKDD
jgi:mediator of RNA polymerase II transcription subunit 10